MKLVIGHQGNQSRLKEEIQISSCAAFPSHQTLTPQWRQYTRFKCVNTNKK